MKKSELKKFLNKLWWILWKDDSFKGWLISLIFIFIVIKFIFFPTLNLVTGTELPLAIVDSCSMHHKGNVFNNFDNWWENHDNKYSEFTINNLDFAEFNFKRGFTKGDILFIVGTKPEKLEIGDVIIFASGINKNPIIHRIINIEIKDGKYFFDTIGDNNLGVLVPNNNPGRIDERNISEEQLVGKAIFRIAPRLGWGKLIFFEHKRPKSERGFCSER